MLASQRRSQTHSLIGTGHQQTSARCLSWLASAPGKHRQALLSTALQLVPDVTQAARDGLARLHGEPKQAVLTEEQAKLAQPQAEADAEAQELHSHDQITVLDSLVRRVDPCDKRPAIRIARMPLSAYAGNDWAKPQACC